MRVAATVGVVAAGCVVAAAAEDSAHEDVLRRFLAKGKAVKCRGGASDVEEVLETPKTLVELMQLDAVSMEARLEEVEAEAAFWDETDAEGIALEPEAVLPSGWCSWRCEEEESVYLKSFKEVEALREKYEAEFETDEYEAIAAKVLEGTASKSEIAKHEKRVEAARALIPAAKGANRLRSYIENFCVAQAGEDCSTLKVLAKDSATDLKEVHSRLVDNQQSLTRSLESEIVSSRAGGSVSEQWCDWFCLEWEKKFDDTHQQVLERMTRTLSAVDSGRVLSKKKSNRKVAAALNYYEDLRDQIADFCA